MISENNNSKRSILKVMSYNVQVGISTEKPHHYVLHSWKHLIPHSFRLTNLNLIADLMEDYDIVGLQEIDAGSIRSNFINLAEFLAERAKFPFWYHQVNRNLGHIAQHASGLLSRYQPDEVTDIRLPGFIPGRRAIMARYGEGEAAITIFVLHLALSKRARLSQLDFISDYVNESSHAILMGDLNCKADSDEMNLLFRKTRLRRSIAECHTFPSWRPLQPIDHILVTPELNVLEVKALPNAYSDHLPLVMDIVLPDGLELKKVINHKENIRASM